MRDEGGVLRERRERERGVREREGFMTERDGFRERVHLWRELYHCGAISDVSTSDSFPLNALYRCFLQKDKLYIYYV